jgi:ABC-type antimicrobial peptide transport system permease subunit
LGIRIALGAHTAALIRLIVSEHLTPVAIGLGAGVLISAAVVRTLASQLFGIGPADPATWSAIIAMVLGVSAVGILIPAVRAARVNPIESLRAE